MQLFNRLVGLVKCGHHHICQHDNNPMETRSFEIMTLFLIGKEHEWVI